MNSFVINSNLLIAQQLENLGKNINSDLGELLPLVSPDGNTIYFVRSYNKGNILYQETWYSELDYNGNWQSAKKITDFDMPGVFAVNVNSISPDGNTIFLSMAYDERSKSGLHMSKKTISGWSKPERVKIKNYKKYIENSYWAGTYLSNSGKTLFLYFSVSSDPKDHFKKLYISSLNDDGEYSEPKILPSPINVNEGIQGNFAPFLASDNLTLYFASDRKGGYGSSDIYFSKRLDDTWLNWSEPVNLGPEINSSDWDACYSISAKGEYAYLVSYKNSYGESDIFRIKLPEQIKPNPVVLVSGKIVNPATSQPLDAEIYYYTLPDNIEAGTARTNPATGVYKIVLPYGKQYSFLAKVNGYYSISNYLDLTNISTYKEMNVNIEMKPIEVGETFRLNNIFFDFAKASLRSESFQELDRVFNLLNDNTTIEIELSGHTDNVGSDEMNNTLSQSRADAVKDYLVKKGINGSRIISKGYGKSNPVATNDTEEGRQLNRRVEFKILKK